MKNVFSIILTLALLIMFVPNTYAADEIRVKTPEQYIEYLKAQPNSETTISQFESLSLSDQEKYIEYVTNPELVQEIYNAMLSGKTTTLKNGDIKINQPKIGLPHTGGGSIGTYETVRNIEQDFDSVILGLNTFKYRVSLTYSVGGTSTANLQVRKAISANGQLMFSYIPGLSMSFTKDMPYVTNNTAVAKVSAHWELAYSGSGATFGTDVVTLKGYPDGSKSYTREQL